MTQAFNLSQFANRINTSGQADPTNVFSSALPVNQGGSNNASLAVTAGGVLYTDGSKFVNVGAGTSGQLLQSNGASAPTWVAPPVYSGSQIVAFYSPGSWSCPSSTSTAIFIAIGGGGGGNRYSPAANGGGSGGVAVAVGTGLNGSYTITVGAGGNGYQGPATAAGNPGGTSSIVGTNLNITATGGSGAPFVGPTATSAQGARGVGTVTTGTSIRATSAGAASNVTPIFLAGGGANFIAGSNPSPAAQAYSASNVVAAGSGGLCAQNPSGGSGGIGGACFIMY